MEKGAFQEGLEVERWAREEPQEEKKLRGKNFKVRYRSKQFWEE